MKLYEFDMSNNLRSQSKKYWSNKSFEQKKDALINGFPIDSPEGKIFHEIANEISQRNR